MSIEVKIECPLGATCERVSGDAIIRCAWYTCLAGQDPQTGEMLKDTWRCAMSWMPILLVENANTNRGQTAAMESFRNEAVKSAETTNSILLAAAQSNINKRLLDQQQ